MESFTDEEINEIRQIINKIIEEAIEEVTRVTHGGDLVSSNKNVTTKIILDLFSDSETERDEDQEEKPTLSLENFDNYQQNLFQDGWPGEGSEESPTFEEIKLGPFNIEWCFGFNFHVPILYLSQQQVMFSSAHFPIVYDVDGKQMKALIGHRNTVSCLTQGGSFLASADYGPQPSLIVLWSKQTMEPMRCWVSPFPEGTRLIELCPQGEFLVAVSASQRVMVKRWSLTSRMETTGVLPLWENSPKHLIINAVDVTKFVVTFSNVIFLLSHSERDNKFDIVQSTQPRHKDKHGVYRMSEFLDTTIITGTSKGQIVVWTNTGEYLKTVQLKQSGIVNIKLLKTKLVIAHDDGEIAIYSNDLQLQGSLTQIIGPLASISFDSESSATSPSFVAATILGTMSLVTRNDLSRCILYRTPGQITALDTRPFTNIFATGDTTGRISLYHIERKTLQLTRKILQGAVTALNFSPDGLLLAAASEWGELMILDAVVLNVITVLPSAKAAICKLCYSENSKTLLYYHKSMGLGLIKRSVEWVLRGKHRVHSKPITDMTLGDKRLYTIGEDRILAEYDIRHSLRFLGCYMLEQTAIPISCMWNNGVLLVANSECKIRFVDVGSRDIIRTVQGPCTAAIQLMTMSEDMLVYAAGRDIGVADSPPGRWRPQVQAFPHTVTQIAVLGDHIITASKADNSTLVWTWNFPLPSSEDPTFPNFIDTQISRLFDSGPIVVDDLLNKMRLLGFFPTKFDATNILREVDTPDVTEDEFRAVFWNHKPLHGPTVNQLRDALLCLSEMKENVPLIATEKLITAFGTGIEPMTREDVLECLHMLMSPAPIPPQLTITEFMQVVLGIEPSLIDD